MKNKLLNFTICQIFVVIGISVLPVYCEQQNVSPAKENVSHYDRSFQKVLSRRKRFLLWRPGSNVLLTASLVKPLAFPRPGGHNLALEWDIFYPLPSSWYRPTKPTKAAPAPPETSTLAPEIEESWDSHADHPGEVWMPSGGWSSDTDVIKTLSEADAERRLWTEAEVCFRFFFVVYAAYLFPQFFPFSQQRKQNNQNKNKLYGSATFMPVTQYQNPLLKNQPWLQIPKTNSIGNEEINFNQQYYKTNHRQPPSSSSYYSEKNFMADNKQRKMNFMPKGRSLELGDDKKIEMQEEKDASMDDSWKHHQAHRERRDLYKQIENISLL